jgi:hypothetical protein
MRRAVHRSDANEKEIVKELRKIPGVSVRTGHHDLLLGFRNRTYWLEVKNPNRYKKDGSLKKNALQDSQEKLKAEWTGHYAVVSTLEEILAILGIA